MIGSLGATQKLSFLLDILQEIYCSYCSEVWDFARWLYSGEHSASYNPDRGCQWWTDPQSIQTTSTSKSYHFWCSFFFWAKKSARLKIDNDVLGLKCSFMCPLYTWVSSAGRSFLIRHSLVLRVSAPSLCLWGFFWLLVTMLSLKWPYIFFSFDKNEQNIMIVLP